MGDSEVCSEYGHLEHTESMVQPTQPIYLLLGRLGFILPKFIVKVRRMKKKILKGLGYVFTVVVVFVIVIAGSIIYKTIRYPGQVPTVLGYSMMTVLSGSMQPVLKPGDMVGIKNTDVDEIKTGDVITYRVDQNTYVTHRVKEIINDSGSKAFKTQGDANNVEDGKPVIKEQIVGRMAFRIPFGGYVAKFFRTPLGFVLFIIVPALYLIVSELRTVLSDIKENKKSSKKEEDNMEA